jgi:Icc-related predicted phosphoesterase
LKLLLFSDVHCDLKQCQVLVELAEKEDVDFVIGAGDFANFRRGLEPTIEILSQISRPTIVVPGNSESDDELLTACQAWPAATVLHGSGTTVNGVDFWGIGGGIPVTPFGPWSFDFTEAQAELMLAGCPAGSVLVTHSPPRGAVDVSSGGRSLGSIAIRETILARQPRLVVCGHIHESAGQHEMIGPTPVVNAGPRSMVWELQAP